VSKGSRQNRSVPLVKRLALRIGQFGIVLETGFSYGKEIAAASVGAFELS
jgi:hypothetical protein